MTDLNVATIETARFYNKEHNWMLITTRGFTKGDSMAFAELIIVDLNTMKELEEYVDDVDVYDWEAID